MEKLSIEIGNTAGLKSVREVPGDLDLPDHLMFAGEKHIIGFLERNNFKVISHISYRFDTGMNFVKSVIKKLIGRKVNISFPYTSKYRSVMYRAKKINQWKKAYQRIKVPFNLDSYSQKVLTF